MSQPLCHYCHATMHPRDGHRECPSCLGMAHLLEDIEKPCPAAAEFSLQERVQRASLFERATHDKGASGSTADARSLKRRREHSPVEVHDGPSGSDGRRSRASDPQADTQMQILATLRDLAGKMDHFRPQNMGLNTQQHAVPSVVSEDDIPPNQGGRGNIPDTISLHAHDSLFGSNDQDMGEEDQGDESRSSANDRDSTQPDILTRILSAARMLGLKTPAETSTASVVQGVWAGVSQSQPSVSIPVTEDYVQMLSKAWNNPKAAPQFNAGCRRFANIHYAAETGMGGMPAVEREMASLTPLGLDRVTDDPRCPRKECEKTDNLVCRTYNSATRAARSGNALAIILASLRKLINPDDQDIMGLVDAALVTHAQLTRDIGASMSSAILSRRQIWLAQTSLPDTIRKELTYMPVTPGRVFNPDSQSTLDKAEQARRRRESVQRTFGPAKATRQSYRGYQHPHPPHFSRPGPWEFSGRQNTHSLRFDNSRSAGQAPRHSQMARSRTSVRDAPQKKRNPRGSGPYGGNA
jgi:hypothetical protein